MRVDIQANKRGCILITTLEPVAYTVGATSIVIPPGYVSDGLSVPRFLWGILSPKVDGRTLHAGVCHDHAYEHHTATRREADRFLRDDLVRHGFPLVLSYVCWLGVRCFGWLFW